MPGAVFLDRDGVVISAVVRDGKPFPPRTIEEVHIDPDAAESLAALTTAGYPLILITNQPDVARGTQDQATVEAINGFLRSRLPIDACYVCYHDDSHHCNCRKPKPGLIMKAAEELHIDLTMSFVVGDRWRDVEAGRAAGCRTIWIDRAYSEAWRGGEPDVTVTSLREAIDWILSQPNPIAG